MTHPPLRGLRALPWPSGLHDYRHAGRGAGFGVYWCGSLASTIGFSWGDSLNPDAYLKSFGSALAGCEAKSGFHLWNRSGRVYGSWVRRRLAPAWRPAIRSETCPRGADGTRGDGSDQKKTGPILQGLQLITDDRTSPGAFLSVVGNAVGEARSETLTTK